VNPKDIFLDHAGFDTYNSVVRAKKIFKVKDLIIVTQKFHLPRAIFIARQLGLDAYGYIADRRPYQQIDYYQFRESVANLKATLEVAIKREPKYLGNPIPIHLDSKVSWD
jgi:SanA protein